ncbi:MAG TPA: HDOD domain-containing protein [Anaerolineae bacterium]|nr:HDOD domain-containing protein [Anaerolineae bacterium]
MTVLTLPNQAQVKRIVSQVDNLKPLPSSITRALKMMDDPEASFDQLVSILQVDQALTVRILKQANSAYYGFRAPASTLQEGIIRLGMRRLKNILLTLSFSSTLGRRLAGYNLGHGDLWRHSVAVAMVAQRLAERVHYANVDEAYVAGLLHDLGKLVLDQHFKIDWTQVLEAGREFQLSLIDVEEKLFEMNHAQVGGELAQRWELPAELIDAIAYHHMPVMAKTAAKLTAIVHIADILALRLGIGLTDEAFLPEPQESALTLLNLKLDEVDNLAQVYKKMLILSMVVNEDIMPS